MNKQTILFKASALTIQAIPVPKEVYGYKASALVITVPQSVLLDAAAAEVLVSYLKVMRAFFAGLKPPKSIAPFIYEQVARQLWEIVQQSGRCVALYADISELIQQMGCAHEWAQSHHESLTLYTKKAAQ
jgi:hypothetical protein